MDPITRCRFKVVIAGGSGNTSSELTATAIGAVQSSLGVAKHKKGTKTLTARSSESSVTVSRMRIEFNVGSPGWKDVITWWSDTNDFGKPLNKRNVEVIIYDGEESAVQSILLEGAWPCRFGFMGGTTNGDSGSMGQYLDFISEGFRISAKQQAQKDPAGASGGKSKTEFKNEIKIDKIDIKTGDISGMKDSFKMNDSLKASGLAKVSAKAAMSMGGGALSAVGALASLAKPAPKLSATATSSSVVNNNNAPSSNVAGPGASGAPSPATTQTAGGKTSTTTSTAGGTSGGPISQSRSTQSVTGDDVAPMMAAGAVAATSTAAVAAGLNKDVKAATDSVIDSAPDVEAPETDTETLEMVSADTESANRSASVGNHMDSASDESESSFASQASESGTESGSAMAAAAAMGAIGSIARAMSGSGKTTPTIDLSSNSKVESASGAKESLTESKFQKSSKSSEATSQSENAKSDSKSATEQSDQTLATRSALKTYGQSTEKTSSENGGLSAKQPSTQIKIGKEDFTLDNNAEKTKPITVYLEETDKSYPDVVVHETGGMTDRTSRIVRDLVEKDLCAEEAAKKGKAVEYRWCGKIIYLKQEKDSLVFRIRDEALRAALHDSLKALFH